VVLVDDDVALLNEATGLPLFTVEEAHNFVLQWDGEGEEAEEDDEDENRLWPLEKIDLLEPRARKEARELIVHHELKRRLGDNIYGSWFQALEVEGLLDRTVTVSVPVRFIRNWIEAHYSDELLESCREAFVGDVEQVKIVMRTVSLCPRIGR
jgi:hypothetical protein